MFRARKGRPGRITFGTNGHHDLTSKRISKLNLDIGLLERMIMLPRNAEALLSRQWKKRCNANLSMQPQPKTVEVQVRQSYWDKERKALPPYTKPSRRSFRRCRLLLQLWWAILSGVWFFRHTYPNREMFGHRDAVSKTRHCATSIYT